MRVGVRVAKNEEKFFENYDDALDYIDTFISEIEALNISTDDIIITNYGG